MSKASGLKGTKIGISEDLTKEQQEQRKVIYDHYKAAKERNYKAKLYNNGVNINGTFYKYEDLKNQDLTFQQTARLFATNNQFDSIFASGGSEQAVNYRNQDKSSSKKQKNPTSQPVLETRSRTNSKSSTSSLDQAVSKRTTKK